MSGFTLSAADTARLERCLQLIGDESSGERWAALSQLRHFCDGANTQLLEVIGGSFNALETLIKLLEAAESCGGPAAVAKEPEAQRVPVAFVLQLLEALLCSAPNNLEPFLRTETGCRVLVRTLNHAEEISASPEGIALLDSACNVLCYLTYHHPLQASQQFVAADGVAVAARLVQCAHAHYTRTHARPGTALPSRPPPEAPSEIWDSLTGNIAELVANVSGANSHAQKELALGGALRSILDILPLLTFLERKRFAPNRPSKASRGSQLKPSRTMVTEQLLLAASTLVWTLQHAQCMLIEPRPPPHEGGVLEALIRALCTSYSRLTAGGSGSEAASQHDTVVYQATLLLVLSAQNENKKLQDAAVAAIRRFPKGAQIESQLGRLSQLYYQMFDACEHINLNHFHSDEVVKGLKLISSALNSSEEAPYFFVHMNGRLDMLKRCLSNIDAITYAATFAAKRKVESILFCIAPKRDEDVLFAALCALYCLISRSPPARLLFLRKRGIGELYECLHDYNTAIIRTSLQILCVLASTGSAARDEMRTEEVLLGVLRIVERFPADDVTLSVLDAALEAVSNIVVDSSVNQDYIRENNGLEPLVLALTHCHEKLASASAKGGIPQPEQEIGNASEPAIDHLKVAETACLALGNVVYGNSENQQEALEFGALHACIDVLQGARVASNLHAAALQLLVNLTDINLTAQDMLCTDKIEKVLLELLECPETPQRVLCGLCLLLSHAVWNHPRNQQRFGSERFVKKLFSLLSQHGDLTLYCLMALVNLSYANPQGQACICGCGGIPALLGQLSSPLYEVRRTASFCLGNLVKENLSNAQELVRHGGVELLVRCLNDDEEDELSKTAYSALCLLGEVRGLTTDSLVQKPARSGLSKLLHLVRSASSDLEANAGKNRSPSGVSAARGGWVGAGGGRSALADGAMRAVRQTIEEIAEVEDLEDLDDLDMAVAPVPAPAPPQISGESSGDGAMCVDGARSGELQPSGTEVTFESSVALLELCLPVLNGMVYTMDSHRVSFMDKGGLPLLLSLLSPAVNPDLKEYALHVLLNAFFGLEKRYKQLAVEQGAVPALQRAATAAFGERNGSLLAMCYAVLASIVQGCAAGCSAFLAEANAVEQMLRTCSGAEAMTDASEASDARERAAELLLALAEDADARAALLRRGGRAVLTKLADAKDWNQLLAAKALQVLKEAD